MNPGNLAKGCGESFSWILPPVFYVLLNPLFPALEIAGVLWIALAFVIGILRVRAERARTSREGLALGHHKIGRDSVLNPTYQAGKHVEIIERGRAAGAVVHAGHEEKAAPILDLLEAAVVLGHALVIGERVERRKDRVACAVIEDQLAAVTGKSRKVRPRGVGERLVLIGCNTGNHLVDGQILRGLHGGDHAGSLGGQQTREYGERASASRENVTGVPRETRIHFVPL